jgi:hypothetical protein
MTMPTKATRKPAKKGRPAKTAPRPASKPRSLAPKPRHPAPAAKQKPTGMKGTDGRNLVIGEESRQFYETRLRAQLNEIQEMIEELEYDMETADWDPMSDYHKVTDDIHINLAEAREKVEDLESAADADWGAAYEEAKEAVENVGQMYEKISKVVIDLLPD